MLRPRSLILFVLIGLYPQVYAAHAQEQNFRISGTVVDASSGVPLATADVSIVGTGGLRIQTSVKTDAQGGFVFEHLISGKYLLSARTKDYPQQSFQRHENFSTAIAVGTDLDSENILFRLFASASLEGQVLDEFSEPVRAAQVMLFREGIGDGSQSVRMQTQMATDDRGRYRFRRLQPGRYYIAAMAQPWYAQHITTQSLQQAPANGLVPMGEQNAALDVVYPITYYSGAIDPARASAITLQPGERADADFTLEPVPALHLRLTAPMTDLSQNVGVRVSQTTLGGHEVQLPIQRTLNNKEFVDLAGFPPGSVIVGLDSPPAPESKERISWRQSVDASRNATVNMTEVAGTVAVGGIVKNTGIKALPQSAAIAIHDQQSGATIFARIAPDGKFEFPAPAVKPGKYDLSMSNAPEFFVARFAAAGAKVSGRSIEIGSEQPVQLSVEVGAGMGSIEGVALRNGKPTGGVMIMLVPQDFENESPLLRRDQSDSDGTFTLSAVPGQYTLVAVENGWDQEWANPSVVKMWLKAGEPVEVAPNGKYTIKVNVQ